MKIEDMGFSGLQRPVKIEQQDGSLQHTIATISMQAQLATSAEDNYLNDFSDILDDFNGDFSIASFSALLPLLKQKLAARSVRLTLEFPYFMRKTAPVSKTDSMLEYGVKFSGGIGEDNGFILSVIVPVTTLCPCSKEISDAGAHNQRAEVQLNVKFSTPIWAEELIRLVEESASCELYALLKRPDEKYVTEKAYNNPMFVEDVVRKVATSALAHPDITWFSASVESFESIHNHSAYAYVDSDELTQNIYDNRP